MLSQVIRPSLATLIPMLQKAFQFRGTEFRAGNSFPALVLSTVWLLGPSRVLVADSADHPYLETRDLNSTTCLQCHPTKDQGKFVHSAIAMGCNKCHGAASQDYKTTMALVATGGTLCKKCHAASDAHFQHQPYQAGECLICHNPHASEFRAQTRAPINTLCLSCHGLNQPDVKVDTKAEMVSLLDGRSYDLASFEQAPKIDGSHHAGNAKAEADCLSCHEPHASELQHLLRKSGQKSTDIGSPARERHSGGSGTNGKPARLLGSQGHASGGRA